MPNSSYIAFGFENDNVKIVSASTCTQTNSFSTGHSKVYDIDFNMEGTKMVTCGDDKKFRVWNSSASTFFTSTPPSLGGGFDCGEVVMSCKLSYEDDVLIGVNSINRVRVYSPPYSSGVIYMEKNFNPTGVASHVNFVYC